jgi:putative DNA primase/helicase
VITAGEVSSPAPRALADKYLTDVHPRQTMQWWRGEWWIYSEADGWQTVTETALRALLADSLKNWWYSRENKQGEIEEKRVYALLRESMLRDVLGQCRQPGRSLLPDATDAPMWTYGGTKGADELLPVENGLLDIPKRKLRDHCPNLFIPNRLSFSFQPDAPLPSKWLNFLAELWPDDRESIDLRQEFFGYLLTGDTRYQKMLMVVGPKRSGKGTIAKIAEALTGKPNSCSPTLGSLAMNFGLASIINKRLAVVGDARLSGRSDSAIVVERLLSLSGGDLQTIPRKNREDWIGIPKCRFMLLSNELPRLPDASGAIASRFLLLQTFQSFYGREDHGLAVAILAEMPGILNWSLDGLERLTARGRFPKLESAAESMRSLESLGSPVAAFARDWCELGAGHSTTTTRLYSGFQRWCETEGIDHVSSQAVFGRDLVAAFPEVRKSSFRSGDGRREWNYTGIRLLDQDGSGNS